MRPLPGYNPSAPTLCRSQPESKTPQLQGCSSEQQSYS